MKVAQILGHQDGQVAAKHFGCCIPEHALGSRIDEDDGALLVNRDDGVGGRLSQRSEAALAFTQLLLGPLALKQLPDPTSYRGHCVEQVLVALARFSTEEFKHAEDFVSEQDRKTKAAAKALFHRKLHSRKVRVGGKIGDP